MREADYAIHIEKCLGQDYSCKILELSQKGTIGRHGLKRIDSIV